MIGTIQKNRSGIPAEINRDDLSTMVYWCDDNHIVMSSYVVKTKSSGKKNVLLLSATRPLSGITKDDGKKKPALYKLYDFTKGGTDECDQRAESCRCKPKSRKWTIVSFSYVLDMARINSGTILALNRNESPRRSSTSSFDIGWNLSRCLILPYVQARSLNGLTRSTQLKISLVLGNERQPNRTAKKAIDKGYTCKRCRDCMDGTTGEGHKKKKDNQKKVSTSCDECQAFICSEHLTRKCSSCV